MFGAQTLVVSAILSVIGLFVAGVLVSRVTARSWWFSGLRQLFVGVLAAVVTFGVGHLVGTSLG
jgi:VIT1/CCC1 family predicted Fe2+/Mn2+ transporter